MTDETLPALRVLHVNHTAHPGGAELALVRLLVARHWHADLCVPHGGARLLDRYVDRDDAFRGLSAQGVTLDRHLRPLPRGGTRSNSPALALRYLAALRTCARILRGSPLFLNADIIHANTAAAAIISAMANRGRATPLVVHLRDLVNPQSLGRFGYTAFIRFALRHADGVIANSQRTLESAAGLIPPGAPAVVIPSPIGLTRRARPGRTSPSGAGTDQPSSGGEQSAEGRHDGVPTVPPAADLAADGSSEAAAQEAAAERASRPVEAVGMIGRLQEWKGQHVFLEAFAQAFPGTVRARLAGASPAGETGYENELRALAARLGIADRVSFLGHVSDIDGFLDSVDILVHASTRPEPLGQSVLQGLATGKPVIATEGGGPSEWIRPGVNGLLVKPDRPEELAAALRSLADSTQARSRLAAAAAGTAGILTDDESARLHERFFRDVVERHGGARGAGRKAARRRGA